ncbi:MAG: TonB-dependent receptor plug domain-containing protein [Bacteroidia bacterium]
MLLGLALACAKSLQAQQDSSFTLDQVSLEADRLSASRATSDATSFTSDSMGQFSTAGISADAVLRQAEGLYVRNYGGHGGVRSLSVRGYAAPQTTVSINGVPYLSPQSGVINFGNFYPEGYTAIELTRSGSSGDASLAALGGNVDFQLSPQTTGINIKVARGAFGESLAGMRASLKRRQWHSQAGIQLLEAEDNFPYQINGETGLRSGAAFRTARLMAQLGYRDSSWSISWFGTAYRNSQGLPGPILRGNPGTADDKLEEEDTFQALSIRKSTKAFNSWKPSEFRMDVAFHSNDMQYLPASGVQEYVNRDLLIQLKMNHLGKKSRTQTVLQVQPAWLRGNNLAIGFDPVAAVQRTVWRLATSRQYFTQIQNSKLGGYINARLGYSSGDGWLPEASLGFTWKLPKKRWELFFHANQGLRLPAFNELYYFGYGNAALPPERILGGDFGLWHQKKLGSWRAVGKLAFFANRTRDKIVAIPLNPAVWSTRAVGLSRSLGLEASLEFLLKENRFYLNYTLQDVRDVTLESRPYLPYTPVEILSYGMVQRWSGFQLGLHGHYSGWRFTLPVIEETAFLPAWHTLDLDLAYAMSLGGWQYRFGIQGENILNEHYAVIKSWPMPPASWRAVLIVQF